MALTWPRLRSHDDNVLHMKLKATLLHMTWELDEARAQLMLLACCLIWTARHMMTQGPWQNHVDCMKHMFIQACSKAYGRNAQAHGFSSRAHAASTALTRPDWCQAGILVEAKAALLTIASSSKQQACPQWTPRQLALIHPLKGQPSQDTLSSSAKEISGLPRPERLF